MPNENNMESNMEAIEFDVEVEDFDEGLAKSELEGVEFADMDGEGIGPDDDGEEDDDDEEEDDE